ncbi:MAG: hypothetical protein KR126chlam3_00466 [Chlamydiae bacterium]|nr:hypothetical protein [Chlamydiota bacterium]
MDAFLVHALRESKGTSLLEVEKERKKKEKEWLSNFDDDNWTPFWADFAHEIKLENIWPDLMEEIRQRKISH